ncbi:MAG: SMR family transporter [Thermodesulfobacteriota bacterium]|nr:SMR family transporter [Thermodesulfobacteriota bacterium]
MFLYFLSLTNISPVGWGCVFVTSILHALYFWFLGEAYELGDLSVVYPLARGIGTLLVPFLAVSLIKEQLSALGILGITLIISGILLHLSFFPRRKFLLPFLALRGRAFCWALGTGGSIASYSLVDKIGVNNVYPPVYVYLMFVGAWFILTPYILVKKRVWLKVEWEKNMGTILAVGFLTVFTYLLVLFAMQMSKLSYVVALRESSILFSVLYGTLWLREEYDRQKLLGAVLIFLGVFFIGLSK